jgi:hypothetical protein
MEVRKGEGTCFRSAARAEKISTDSLRRPPSLDQQSDPVLSFCD